MPCLIAKRWISLSTGVGFLTNPDRPLFRVISRFKDMFDYLRSEIGQRAACCTPLTHPLLRPYIHACKGEGRGGSDDCIFLFTAMLAS